jgi:RHS repeat-associated protein
MLGSTRKLTDAGGAVQQSYDYDPYGNPISLTVSVANPFQFAGQYNDTASGLYYLRARYYDPTASQITTRDPAATATRQPYLYAAESPVTASDPSGLVAVGLCRSVSISYSQGIGGGAGYEQCLGVSWSASKGFDIAVLRTPSAIVPGASANGVLQGQVGTPGLGLSAGIGGFCSATAKNLNDLGQGFNYAGASGGASVEGVPVYGGGNYVSGTSPADNSQQSVVEGSIGLGVSGGEVHSGYSYTYVSHNPWDIAGEILSWLL